MVEVSNELIYDMLKKLQVETGSMLRDPDEMRSITGAIRQHLTAAQIGIHDIYEILDRHDARLTRIERRLDIAEVT